MTQDLLWVISVDWHSAPADPTAQTLTLPSCEPLASLVPSMLHATEETLREVGMVQLLHRLYRQHRKGVLPVRGILGSAELALKQTKLGKV